jgi:multiple sugar transport system substrate-binding protein
MLKKKMKGVSLLVFLVAGLLLLVGAPKSYAAKQAKIPTTVTKKTTVTFWHAMTGTKEQTLETLTNEFMKKNPNIKVVLQNQATYDNLQAKINTTLKSPKDLPTITQSYPGWLWDAAQNKQLVNLGRYMDNKTIGFKKSEKINSAMLEGAQIKGVQYGIPFNKSTDILYYNEDLLKKYDVKVPTNLAEYQAAAEEIYHESNGEVVGGGFDTLNNYYQMGMNDLGMDTFTKTLNFSSKKSKKVINYYADGVKKGYFRIAGSDASLSVAFGKQTLAMYVGSSSGESYVKKDSQDKFDYGVTTVPETQSTLQGTDIYMFTAGASQEKTAAYLYTKFLTSADATLDWAQQTGYLPVIDSVLASEEYQATKDSKVAAISAKATKDLIVIPIESNLEPVSAALDTVMQTILANPKENTNELIKQGATDIKNSWLN